MKFDNYTILEFPSKSCNEAFARSAVACFAAQMDPTMEELGDIRTAVSNAVSAAAAAQATADSHNQSAGTITAGTFAGQVVANSSGQTYSTSLLRNSKLVSADTNPTVNGEICWTYK